MNIGEARRAQLAKSTLLTSMLVTGIISDLFRRQRESGVRKATGSYRIYSIPGKLQPWFQSLRWTSRLRQNCSLGSYTCSEGPALGQNTDDDIQDRGLDSGLQLYVLTTELFRTNTDSWQTFPHFQTITGINCNLKILNWIIWLPNNTIGYHGLNRVRG